VLPDSNRLNHFGSRHLDRRFRVDAQKYAASAGVRSGSNVAGGASVAASELETQKTLLLVLRGVFKEELRF